MGKRKGRKAPPPKGPKAVVPKIFDCPFCGREKSVTVKVFRKLNEATITCRLCNISYTTRNVSNLTAPVDVYHEWIDEAQKENERMGGENVTQYNEDEEEYENEEDEP
eukprot:CAMPEP_0113882156 /NCGR_PEP_ID=MMETSP0780_2-20120614/8782_1 /TAXON_ID=652834 /ORGANISM="Palpitomonas bilix" /LENGTH=107 /DNA_ID=CAMNT_0000869107 /DNA_START=103 /DNA_END=426 /DNA_ORIENTATION=- /assembly_acc=CAM_ASM_000599